MKNKLIRDSFIGEAIRPVAGSYDTAGMSRGEPGVPKEFIWRRHRFHIKKVLNQWRETGPCTHGSAERYVRQHWYEVITDSAEQMKIYFERQSRLGVKDQRWRLFSIKGRSE